MKLRRIFNLGFKVIYFVLKGKMSQVQLFQQIFSLYSLIISYVKPSTPELQLALKTLKGLYNQYDCIKTSVYTLIVNNMKENWEKYSSYISSEMNISNIFSIITDNLKDNEYAMINIERLKPLASVPLDKLFINKVKRIFKNIEIIIFKD